MKIFSNSHVKSMSSEPKTNLLKLSNFLEVENITKCGCSLKKLLENLTKIRYPEAL